MIHRSDGKLLGLASLAWVLHVGCSTADGEGSETHIARCSNDSECVVSAQCVQGKCVAREAGSGRTTDATPQPETGAPGDTGLDTGYAACPSVPGGPPPGDTRTDSGRLGLRVLREQVEKSREVFRRYDADHSGNYTYRRQSQSFIGTYCDTSVVVEHDVVTSRIQLAGPPSVVLPSASWTETGASVGSHTNGCHPAWTMDQLYDECLNTVLCQDPSRNYLDVHVDARGLLVQCDYFPMNCADDCYSGLQPLILTADGTDWTKVDPACCPISPKPACCMATGGARSTEGGACSEICDGMADPNDGRYGIFIDAAGCLVWGVPQGGPNCCGCPPSDAGAAP